MSKQNFLSFSFTFKEVVKIYWAWHYWDSWHDPQVWLSDRAADLATDRGHGSAVDLPQAGLGQQDTHHQDIQNRKSQR